MEGPSGPEEATAARRRPRAAALSLSFRPARAIDAPAIATLLSEAYSTYVDWAPPGWRRSELDEHQVLGELEERLDLPGTWSLVALDGNDPVGYAALTPARTREEPRRPIAGLGHLWHLFVVPAWWGRGVATHLLAEAMSEAERRRYTAARLWTPRANARARAFYLREGWRETGAEMFAEDLQLDLVEYRRMLVP